MLLRTCRRTRFSHNRPICPTQPLHSQGKPPNSPHDNKDVPAQAPRSPPSASAILASTDPSHNNLLSPVHLPEDADAIIKSNHPATSILAQSGLVVQRQIEMMNLFLGFEQANRYVIMDPHGSHIGYMAEHDGGFRKTMGRQWFKTHRAFTTHVFDRHQKEVLRFHRPFSWINSSIKVYDPLQLNSSISPTESSSTGLSTIPQTDAEGRHISPVPLNAMRVIGEAQSQWAPLRRKYNLFLTHDPSLEQEDEQASEAFMQFAKVDEPILSWDFSLRGSDHRLIGSVNRNFAGFAREIFTDTGIYALRMDSAALMEESEKSEYIGSGIGRNENAYTDVVSGREGPVGMTLDQRAVMLATAVTVDFDYFSRHSHGGGMMGYMPLWFYGGGEAAEVGAAEVGVASGSKGARGAIGGAAGGLSAEEGAVAGAGTIAGYEAMQRAENSFGQAPPDAWGSGDKDPWKSDSGSGSAGDDDGGGGDGGSGEGGGDEEGGGVVDALMDFFDP